jgi:hypothetical protein
MACRGGTVGHGSKRRTEGSDMADDVTLEDLQKVYKRLDALESGLKEITRLLKAQDDYDKDMNKIISDGAKSTGDDMKKLTGRVTDLEKKVGKK